MRLRSVILKGGLERSIDEEFAFHLEMRQEHYREQGLSPQAARRAARRRFGDVHHIRREALGPERRRVNRERTIMLLDDLKEDLRYGLRQIIRRPGFSIVVALILGLGIGANTAIFSVLKGILLRPLPYPDADRLVAVWETPPDGRWHQPFSTPDFLDMREQNATFEEMGAMTFRNLNVASGEGAGRLYGAMVTPGVLRALGIHPARGRLFVDGEEGEEPARVAIVSDATWRNLFDADMGAVGSEAVIDGAAYQVVGIMPPEFEFIRPWASNRTPDLYLPLDYEGLAASRGSHWIAVVGRLSEGIALEQAEADIRTIASRLMEAYPLTNAQVQVWIEPFLFRNLPGVRSMIFILLVVVGIVLLIACANVAAMLLARGTSRMTELAVRSSLGAGRRRLVRQLLTESMLFSLLGGAVGIALAYWGVTGIKGVIPPDVPRTEGISVDNWVLLFALLVTLLTGLIFGLAPALFAGKTRMAGALRTGRTGEDSGQGSNRALSFLVVAQLALAFALSNAAALILVSHVNVTRLPQGFDYDEVLVSRVALRGTQYEEDMSRVLFWQDLLERVRALPGVESAAVTTKIPLRGGWNGSVLVEGDIYDPLAERELVERTWTTEGYPEAMGIALIRGRTLRASDMAIQVPEEGPALGNIVVNRAFAERLYPEVDPIGRLVMSNSDPPEWVATIVGIVEDVRQWGPTAAVLPEIYMPYPAEPYQDSYLVVRGATEVTSLVPGIRSALAEVDPTLPLADPTTMRQVVKEENHARRFYTLLITLFTLTALLLAVAGTYGVMSYSVSRRTHEVGIRVALGARKGSVIGLFLRRGLVLLCLGLAIGFGLTAMAAALVGALVFGIGSADPAVLGGSTLLLAMVVLLATLLPALRATVVDPVETLRTE